MSEFCVTATDFRSNVSRISNCVAFREDRCLILRHGHDLVALVSYEDLQFLRSHRPAPSTAEAEKLPHAARFTPKKPAGPNEEEMPDPNTIPAFELRVLYDHLKNRWHSIAITRWLKRVAKLLNINAPQETMTPPPPNATPPS
jgi:hypothetical protein